VWKKADDQTARHNFIQIRLVKPTQRISPMDNVDTALRFWNDFSSWTPPTLVMYTMLGFGVLSSWVMTRFVAAAPLFAGPISFMVLTFAAMLCNFSFRGVPMMGTSDLQKALLFTTVGHAIAGLILLAVFKVGEKRATG
jgi:hypothetical protein